MPALPCQDECETGNFPPTMWTCWLLDEMKLTVEKAYDDVQYGTGNVSETNACKCKEIILQNTLL